MHEIQLRRESVGSNKVNLLLRIGELHAQKVGDGIKAFDAFLLTAALVVGAAAYEIAKPFVDRMLGREAPETDEGAAF